MPKRSRVSKTLFGLALALALAQPLPSGSPRWIAAAAARAAAPPPKTTAGIPGSPLTLVDALAAARAHNPTLTAARAAVDEARAQVQGARVTVPYNPQVFLEGGPRVGSETTLELDVGAMQRLETGGQRRYRVRRAQAGVAVSRARVDELARQVEAQVARAFYRLLAAQERLTILAENEELARTVWKLAVAREEAGDATQLDVNAARLGLAEATRRTLAERGRRDATRLELARLLGITGAAVSDLSPSAGGWPGVVRVAGTLPSPAPLPSPGDPRVARLMERAVQTRLALAGFPDALRQTRAEIRLADAEASADVGVGLRYSHDDAGEGVLASLRVFLPVFQRNQGPRAQARAKRLRLEAQAQSLRAQVQAQVQRALVAYAQAREAARLYDDEVIEAQRESLGLVKKALDAGSTGVAALLSIQRELLAGREGYLSTRLALALARADLLAALGLPQSADPLTATGGDTSPAPTTNPAPQPARVQGESR